MKCTEAISFSLFFRSKTVILAKNLPARTAVEELRDMFARHGDLARVVLPPNGGVTALVEFIEVGQMPGMGKFLK